MKLEESISFARRRSIIPALRDTITRATRTSTRRRNEKGDKERELSVSLWHSHIALPNSIISIKTITSSPTSTVRGKRIHRRQHVGPRASQPSPTALLPSLPQANWAPSLTPPLRHLLDTSRHKTRGFPGWRMSIRDREINKRKEKEQEVGSRRSNLERRFIEVKVVRQKQHHLVPGVLKS